MGSDPPPPRSGGLGYGLINGGFYVGIPMR